MNKQEYIRHSDVAEFIGFLADIISGELPLKHAYYDRKLKRTLEFSTLYSAFEQYHWNGANFYDNKAEIDVLVDKFQSSNSSQSFYQTCIDTLYWGDGNRKGSLFTHNKNWLDKLDCVQSNVLEALHILTNDELDVSGFQSQYRSNAGFTKLYAFIKPEEFIIYDSRVAAALAYFIILFCQSKQYKSVPPLLQIRLAEAKGNSCRVFNVYGLSFKKWSNSQNHAQSNVYVNWLVTEAFKKATKLKSNQFQNIREIEAALFMIGYDFPEFSQKSASRKKGDKQSLSTKTKTNHQVIFEYVTSQRPLPESFDYTAVLALARKVLSNATQSGQQYASLKFIQQYCNALDERVSIQLQKTTDPRKIEHLAYAKTKCNYELK